MESTNITTAILDKKLESYNFENRNFCAEGEITVTITLGEYRELVTKAAISQSAIDKANSDKYERELENKNLKEENSALKAELYELKKSFDNVVNVEEENEP